MDEEQIIYSALRQSIGRLVASRGLDFGAGFSEGQAEDLLGQLRLTKPPKPELGDWACPCFPLARTFREAPPKIALALAEYLREELSAWEVECAGAYLNFRLPRAAVAAAVLRKIALEQETYGCNQNLAGQKIMVEFSSPNTNKPLHLGHLRNNVLGESISRILVANGAELNKVNIINDRGVHICKSMLAYARLGQRDGVWQTPENSGKKGDHLVGDYYVRFNDWQQEWKRQAAGQAADKITTEEPEHLALKMLKDWEEGEEDVRKLWRDMRQWVLDGIAETYKRCDISFDRLYFESITYKLGLDLVRKGLERGIFQRSEDGAILIDLSAYNLGHKIVRRSDGTSVYITQDLGTAIARHDDFPFDRQIYVVGNEQDYHFKVLFQILRLLGYPWAQQLYHLSYGMVVLPDGKMKSREGTVVDADVLLDSLEELALVGMRERRQSAAEAGDQTQLEAAEQRTASKIALAALHYYLLQFKPQREISFNPKESLAFSGNTGPYLQYVGARIHSIIKKAAVAAELQAETLNCHRVEDWELLLGCDSTRTEWELLKQLRDYPRAVALAAAELDPSHVIKALAELARCFSRLYHDVPILNSEKPFLNMRLDLCRATLRTLQNGMQLCVLPFLKVM